MQKTHKCLSNSYMQTNSCTMEDAKTIGQNVFVFDNIEQALSICHVCANLYLLPLHARPWKHLTKHVYLHTLIV